LIEAIEDAGAGEFDGHESRPGASVLFMYGPDGDALLDVVRPVLARMPLPDGTHAVVQYGPPGSPEQRHDIRP
jgi:hypothetical protein